MRASERAVAARAASVVLADLAAPATTVALDGDKVPAPLVFALEHSLEDCPEYDQANDTARDMKDG